MVNHRHFLNKKIKWRVLSAAVAVVLLGEIFMPENMQWLMSSLFHEITVHASAVPLGEPQVHAEIPECTFLDQLYDGEGAIGKLPSTAAYRDGFSAPEFVTFKELREACGTGTSFNNITAQTYKDEKIAICDADDLYTYSMIVNRKSGEGVVERDYYLSLHLILGNNIEYSEASSKKHYFLPIGTFDVPFKGTFDGQCFEIRQLYFDKDYSPVTFGMFGYIGEGAEVGNFGLYHPFLDFVNPASEPGTIASNNYGTIHDVYVVVDEYEHTEKNNSFVSDNANYVGGIVAKNFATGTIRDSYFAGRLKGSEPAALHPICASNAGTIQNCYYDQDVFQLGNSQQYSMGRTTFNYTISEVKGLTNINIKWLNGTQGMTGTKFKRLLAGNSNQRNSVTNTTQEYWQYPKLYGYTGAGSSGDPFVISTPADLINFPCSYEYYQSYNVGSTNYKFYFKLGNCIDMSEVAEYAYKPQVNYDIITNKVSSGAPVLVEYKGDNRTPYPFTGVLAGTVASNDGSCHLEHHHLTNSDGDLTESHMIYNLTIDTPADSIRHENEEDTGDDYYFAALIGYSYGAAVRNLQIVGGAVSTGDHDLMKSSDLNNVANNSIDIGGDHTSPYYVYVASVIGKSRNQTELNNVHSSAVVRLGTGDQFGTAMGGVAACGYFCPVTNCSNSGDIIGGYKHINRYQKTINEKYSLGGVLGYAWNDKYTTATTMSNIVNHGNIFAVTLVGDDTQTAPTSTCCCAGVSTFRLAANYYATTSKILNDGMIFDGPVKRDASGELMFTEVTDVTDSKGSRFIPEEETILRPVPEELPEGKEVLVDKNTTYIHGVAADCIFNACNKGKIYAFMQYKNELSGVGGGRYYYNSRHYGKNNRNDADIYVFSWATRISGISSNVFESQYNNGSNYSYGAVSADTCCNKGNIYVFDGAKPLNTSNDNNLYLGGIAALGGCYSCYNAGTIYIAPSNSTNNSSSDNIYVAGCSQYTSYQNNNNNSIGKIILDYDKYHYEPKANTSSVYGVAGGYNNNNYSLILFYHNTQAQKPYANIRIYGCGEQTIDGGLHNCVNYADIYVDASEGNKSISSLSIYGVGTSYTNWSQAVMWCTNVGNIAFAGETDDLRILTIGSAGRGSLQNCMNLGNVTVTEGSRIGSANVVGFCPGNRYLPEHHVSGWRKGCSIYDELTSLDSLDYNRDILDRLDEDTIYGVFDLRGYYGSLVVCPGEQSGYYSCDYFRNYGQINIENAYIAGRLVVSAISHDTGNANSSYNNSGHGSHNENYADININNVVTTGDVYVRAGATGSYNINYGNIDIQHVVKETSGDAYMYVSGMAHCRNGCTNCENRGNITIHDMGAAIYNETTYEARYHDLSTTTGGYYTYCVGGISTSYYPWNSDAMDRCANYGNITIKNPYAQTLYVAGITTHIDDLQREQYGGGLHHRH